MRYKAIHDDTSTRELGVVALRKVTFPRLAPPRGSPAHARFQRYGQKAGRTSLLRPKRSLRKPARWKPTRCTRRCSGPSPTVAATLHKPPPQHIEHEATLEADAPRQALPTLYHGDGGSHGRRPEWSELSIFHVHCHGQPKQESAVTSRTHGVMIAANSRVEKGAPAPDPLAR